MLTKIEARNFKVFGDEGISLPLSPLTMLLGPNGSGKSSFFDAISLISQTARNQSAQMGFGWKGDLVDFGLDGSYAFHNRQESAPLCIGVTLEANGKTEDLQGWQRHRKRMPDQHFGIGDLGYRVSYLKQTEEWSHELFADDCSIARNYVSVINSIQGYFTVPHLYLDGRVSKYVSDARDRNFREGDRYVPSDYGPKVLSPGLFYPANVKSGETTTQFDASIMPKIGTTLGLFVSFIRDLLAERVFVVGADRMSSNQTAAEQWAQGERLHVGRHGEHTLSVLSFLLASPDHSAQAEQVKRWASIFGLSSLKAGWLGKDGLKAGFQDPQSHTALQLAHSGFGSQQILPVITQLFCSPVGSIVMIEEPEISLHPEAQVQLLRMFVTPLSRVVRFSSLRTVRLLFCRWQKQQRGTTWTPRQLAFFIFLVKKGPLRVYKGCSLTRGGL